MGNNQKLELTWFGKEEEIKIEPRILIEDKEKSNCENDTNTQNMIIHGDNLLALKALESKYAGQVKCIYIDPPYNIAVANPNYDDNLLNSQWLNLMKPRLQLLWKLLTKDGLLAVQIDDEQFAKLFLMLEEICSQKKMKIICVKMSEPTGVKMASVNKSGSIPKLKEFIILAKKDGIKNLNLEKIPKGKWDNEYRTYISNISDNNLEIVKSFLRGESTNSETNIDNILEKITFDNINEIAKSQGYTKADDEWCYENAKRIIQIATLTGGARKLAEEKKLTGYCKGAFVIETTTGKRYAIKSDFNHKTKLPRCKLLFADDYLTVNIGDLWTDIKTTGLDNEGVVEFKNSKKPEKLIKRIIQLNTNEGDLVLDSFLGSGTTCAVAHKMNRRYIGIEMGDHAYTHCKVRLDKVIDGSDQGGISKSVNWQGGGAYKFYELAPTLINKDDFGEYVINKEYDADMLASAVALHEGFSYEPDNTIFWKQSKGNENSYLFVTTRHLNSTYIDSIESTMEDGEYLIIACKSFENGIDKLYSNITIKKIPQMLLSRCEFDKENYNLNIINPPIYDYEEELEDE